MNRKVLFVLTVAILLAVTLPVCAQGPVRGTTPLTGWRRPALATAQWGGWAWGCAYSDSLSIYAGVKTGYRVGTAAASRFLTPKYAR